MPSLHRESTDSLITSSWGCGQMRSTSGVLSCEGEIEKVLQIHILVLVRLLVKHFGETLALLPTPPATCQEL